MNDLYRNRAFMRLFLGRVITNAGDSVYGIAAMWLVFDLTGSTFYTGIAGFLTFGPQALQFLVGPLVDRWPLRKLLVGTQLVQFFGVLLVPIAAVTGHLSVWVILILMPALAFLNQFVYPAQHSALPKIVSDEHLVTANSLFSFAYKGTDLAFTAMAGALIAVIGAVSLYALDAVTFAVAVLLFVGLHIPETDEENEEEERDEADQSHVKQYLDDLREGLDYIRGTTISTIIVGSLVVNAAYAMMIAVLPAFADALGGPQAYGLLAAAMGGGSLVGSAIASVVEHRPYGKVAIVTYTLSAACLYGAVAVSGLVATVFLVFAAFIPSGVTSVLFRSMVQAAIDDSLLGRVFSVISSFSSILMPVGAFIGGTAAVAVGNEVVIMVLPTSWALLAIYFLLQPKLRGLPVAAKATELSLGIQQSGVSADD